MANTIVVVGFGPGISTAVAERFGSAGLSVALVARSPDRLAAGVAALEAKGITAAAIPADAADPAAMAAAIAEARTRLGPIAVIHWNAYGGSETGDLLAADPAAVGRVFNVAILGLLAAVQAALPDLKAAEDGAVLVTNGAFGDMSPQMDQLAINLKSMGVALANAAKAKLVGLLAQALKDEGVYVGEVTVAGAVKGTAWARGGEGIDPARIAGAFWDLRQGRGEIRARIS
jgi:NAD(P)-dependent dehydrogenase (short-subunit alcohol dehydrogenase family)